MGIETNLVDIDTAHHNVELPRTVWELKLAMPDTVSGATSG